MTQLANFVEVFSRKGFHLRQGDRRKFCFDFVGLLLQRFSSKSCAMDILMVLIRNSSIESFKPACFRFERKISCSEKTKIEKGSSTRFWKFLRLVFLAINSSCSQSWLNYQFTPLIPICVLQQSKFCLTLFRNTFQIRSLRWRHF